MESLKTRSFQDKPMASEGYTSYRYLSTTGYLMIGALDHFDALQEASRSLPNATAITQERLDVYVDGAYTSATAENNPTGDK